METTIQIELSFHGTKSFSIDKLRYVSVVDDAALQADLSGALSTLLEAWCIMIRTIYSDLRLAHRRWWLIFIDILETVKT